MAKQAAGSQVELEGDSNPDPTPTRFSYFHNLGGAFGHGVNMAAKGSCFQPRAVKGPCQDKGTARQ